MSDAATRSLRPLIADNALDLIGRTPMVRLRRIVPAGGADLLAKMEMMNPAGSVKDRIALAMIEEAERAGKLRPGDTIVEPTSGNTGIGLAMVAAVKGYKLILTMPEDMSVERRKLLARYGVQFVLTPAIEGMSGAVYAAQEILEKTPNCFMPQQFENPANPQVHRLTTAVEILDATEGRVDAFVAGVGTGGTISGVGRVLKDRIPDVLIVAVEPTRSPVLQGGRAGMHAIQGIGASFVPGVFDRAVVDEIMGVSDEDSIEMMQRLAREEGLLVGVSSGANVFAALKVAARLGAGKRVVTILPDTGERYLSLPG
ncbi:MAG: cysteine synthase A [Dehalococcoidia bacterium]|nr:cysteine synthase A [Dehalococcoidia bacterium]